MTSRKAPPGMSPAELKTAIWALDLTDAELGAATFTTASTVRRCRSYGATRTMADRVRLLLLIERAEIERRLRYRAEVAARPCRSQADANEKMAACGMILKELAYLIGCSPQVLTAYRAGRRTPGEWYYKRINARRDVFSGRVRAMSEAARALIEDAPRRLRVRPVTPARDPREWRKHGTLAAIAAKLAAETRAEPRTGAAGTNTPGTA